MKAALRSAFFGASLGFAALGMALPLAVSPAVAQDAAPANGTQGGGSQGHEQALKDPAGKFVQDLGDQAISVIANKGVSTEQRNEKFRQILRDSFDLTTIGRFVIGRSWNSATPDHQKEYITLFQELVVKTYGDRMSLYTGEGFEVVGTRQESEKDTIVLSHITHPDGSQPTEIDWRVRKRDGKLGIIDVVVEGVSLSVTQRQEYSSIIQRNGGQIDGLLDLMRQQVQAPTPAPGTPPAGQPG